MRLGLRGQQEKGGQEEGREMRRGEGRGEKEFSSSSDLGSGCPGAPQGWSAQFLPLLVHEACHWPWPP